jgi:hypothetical protein
VGPGILRLYCKERERERLRFSDKWLYAIYFGGYQVVIGSFRPEAQLLDTSMSGCSSRSNKQTSNDEGREKICYRAQVCCRERQNKHLRYEF